MRRACLDRYFAHSQDWISEFSGALGDLARAMSSNVKGAGISRGWQVFQPSDSFTDCFSHERLQVPLAAIATHGIIFREPLSSSITSAHFVHKSLEGRDRHSQDVRNPAITKAVSHQSPRRQFFTLICR